MNVRFQWVLIGIITLLLLRTTVQSFPGGKGLPDFGDFYCAGAAQNAGGTPYRWADLDRCGNVTNKPMTLPSSSNGHRPPAPIPGYDIAFFQIVAALPYLEASYLWLALCTAGLIVAIFCISEIATIPPLIVFGALAFPMFRACLFWGQLPALIVAFISIAAYALQRKRYTIAALAAASTLIEPHLGIPTCLALFCWVPQTRYTLAVCSSALIAISLAAIGVAGNYEFFHTILPLHVRAEAPFIAQLSLTWLLYVFGVDETIAVRIAEFSYYLMVAFAIFCTRKMEPVYVAIVPAALAVLGGPFIHINQVEVASVAALVLAGRKNSPLAWSAVAILSVVWFAAPWLTHRVNVAQLTCALIVATLAAYALRARSPVVRSASSVAALALYLGITTLILHTGSLILREPDLAAYQSTLVGLKQYASAPWGMRRHALTDASSLLTLLLKLPSWIALGIVAWQCWPKAPVATTGVLVPRRRRLRSRRFAG